MHSDDNRKRKATQAVNTSSKKHKTDSPTTSRVTLDTPTRPATRSISKSQPTSTAKASSTRRKDPSPGPSQPTADTHRTRSKTGSLKLKKRPRSPSEDRTPPPPIGLSQWVAEQQKLRENENSRSSPRTSLTKKRQKVLPKPPPKPQEVIVISSDEDEDPRPRKRTRRHTTQVSEIIDLSKDDTPPPPRPRPTRPRPARLSTPTVVASPNTPASSASPSKYLDLRRLSFSKSKSKTTPSKTRRQTQSPNSWPLKTKLPAAPSPAETRRKRLNDKFADDDERGSPASKLPAVEVVLTTRKSTSTPTPTPKSTSKPNLTPKTEPGPELKLQRNSSSTHAAAGAVRSVFEESKGKGGMFERGRKFLSKELRVRLQDREKDITSPALPTDSTTTTGPTSTITGDANVHDSSTALVIKLEDVEDTYIDYQPSVPNLTHAAAGAVGSVFEKSKGGMFERGRKFLSKELRARLQDQEEEDITPPALPTDSATSTGTTGTITGDANVDDSSTKLVIKLEDVEDTYIDYQPSVPNFRKENEEVSVVVKEEPPLVEPSPIADQPPLWVDEQEQNDLEEAIFQSMLVASAVEAGVPLENQEGEPQVGVEEQDGSSTVPTVSSSSAPMDDASSVRDPAQPETQVVLEEAEKGEEADVDVKDSEAEEVSAEVPTDHLPCPPTPTPASDLTFDPYLDFELERQEQADLEEALFQSQLVTVYSSSISKCEDEDKSGVDEQGQNQEQDQEQEQVDVAAPPTPTPIGNSNPYEEDVFVIEDPDDSTPTTTNEDITLPSTTSTDDQITHQSPSNDVAEAKDEEATASLARVLFPEFSVPLHQVAAPGPFSCSVPTLGKLVPIGSTSSVFVAGQLTQRFFAQSCLPPKAKTRAAMPVEVEKTVVEVQVAKSGVEVLVEEVEKEEPLVEVQVQSTVEEMQVEEPTVQALVQSEHEEVQRMAEETEAEVVAEELPVQSDLEEMEMPAGLDVDVPGVEDVLGIEDAELEMGLVEAEVDIKCEEGSEEVSGEELEYAVPVSNAVPIPSTADGNGDVDVEMDVLSMQDREASASPSPTTLVHTPPPQASDEDVGVACGIQEVLTTPAGSIAVPGDTQASGDVAIDVPQEVEYEVPQVETPSVTSPQANEDIDMTEPTLHPELEPASSEQTEVPGVEATPVKVKATTTEVLEKDPILSRALHGSRMLLEIIQSIINKPEPGPEVAPVAIQAEEAGSTPGPEAPPPIQDHDMPSSPDEEPLPPQKSTSEPHVEDTDHDTSRRSADVLSFSLQFAEKLTPEPLAGVKGSGDAPGHHEVSSSPRAQTTTPEPSTHETEDVIAAPSGPLEVLPSPPQKLTPESPVFVDNAGEGNITGGTLEPELKDEGVQLPPTPTSLPNSPSQSLSHLPDKLSAQHNPAVLPDEERPCIQSTVATSDKLSAIALDPQRCTISNTGSESSLATLDDSPPPSTPLQDAFESYYIRSTSPDDDLDIFSKITDIPPFPLPESDEDDDEYLLSLNFSYPDFDIVG